MYEQVEQIINKISPGDGRKGFFRKREKIKNDNLKSQLTAWCELLESSKYKQGKDNLLHNKKYCCLGVAGAFCEIPNNILNNYSYPYSGKTIVEASQEELWKFLQNKKLSGKLAQLNDDDHLTFKEIATLIRYKYYL